MENQVIVIKNNKGGVGKTFITTHLASVLSAFFDKKILVITSDSQNNILDYCFEEAISFKNGLKSWVTTGEGDIVKLRENLDFIPLEDNKFGNNFFDKFPLFIESMRKKYDFILIDSSPVLKIDEMFVDISDKIIVPTFSDKMTTRGIVNFLDTVDVNKVLAIVVNKFEQKQIQKEHYSFLEEILKNSPVELFKINNSSFMEKLLEKGKTIVETNSKEAESAQITFIELAKLVINNR